MTDRSERTGEGGKKEIPLAQAVAGILAQARLELFSVPKGTDLESQLALVEDVGSLDDPTLEQLKKVVNGLSASVHNARHSLERGRSYFVVDEEHPEHTEWGTEEGVMRLTQALAAQAENVRVVKECVLDEVQRRGERAQHLREETELAPLRKTFEFLSREQVLEQLVELLEKLLEVQKTRSELDRETEYGSADHETLLARREAALRLCIELEKKIKAAKMVAKVKKT